MDRYRATIDMKIGRVIGLFLAKCGVGSRIWSIGEAKLVCRIGGKNLEEKSSRQGLLGSGGTPSPMRGFLGAPRGSDICARGDQCLQARYGRLRIQKPTTSLPLSPPADSRDLGFCRSRALGSAQRQTNAFRPGTVGCVFELDHVIAL